MISKLENFANLIISESDSIRTAIRIMNEFGQKIVLICDQEKLVGVLTDGDLRKYLQNDSDLTIEVSRIMNAHPVTMRADSDFGDAEVLMKKHEVDAIPVLLDDMKIVGLVTKLGRSLKCHFVIMAGGKGKRLMPYTQNVPKPLVRVAGKPIIEFILEKAAREGIHWVSISVNHLGDLIRSHCGSGGNWGLSIDYISESKPLGTCGSLAELNNPSEFPVIVTNSDVIFPNDYSSLLDFHISEGADVTIAAVTRSEVGKYGELEIKGDSVLDIKEKPTRTYKILGGVYCFSPKIISLLMPGAPMDMPVFLNRLISEGFKIKIWDVSPDWWDIGQEADLLDAERWMRKHNYDQT